MGSSNLVLIWAHILQEYRDIANAVLFPIEGLPYMNHLFKLLNITVDTDIPPKYSKFYVALEVPEEIRFSAIQEWDRWDYSFSHEGKILAIVTETWDYHRHIVWRPLIDFETVNNFFCSKAIWTDALYWKCIYHSLMGLQEETYIV